MKYTKLTLSFLLLFSITVYSQDYNQTKKNIVKSIENHEEEIIKISDCLLYTSPSPRDA